MNYLIHSLQPSEVISVMIPIIETRKQRQRILLARVTQWLSGRARVQTHRVWGQISHRPDLLSSKASQDDETWSLSWLKHGDIKNGRTGRGEKKGRHRPIGGLAYSSTSTPSIDLKRKTKVYGVNSEAKGKTMVRKSPGLPRKTGFEFYLSTDWGNSVLSWGLIFPICKLAELGSLPSLKFHGFMRILQHEKIAAWINPWHRSSQTPAPAPHPFQSLPDTASSSRALACTTYRALGIHSLIISWHFEGVSSTKRTAPGGQNGLVSYLSGFLSNI